MKRITELFDNPYPFESRKTFYGYYGTFTTDNEQEYVMNLSMYDIEDLFSIVIIPDMMKSNHMKNIFEKAIKFALNRNDIELKSREDFLFVKENIGALDNVLRLYEFSFESLEYGTEISNTGDAFRIFSTIKEFFLQTVDKVPKLSIIDFSAKERSRMKLYNTFAKAISANLGLPYESFIDKFDYTKYYMFYKL